MIATKPVHTLDARGHTMLEVMKDHFEIPSELMFREIQKLRYSVEEALLSKGIKYDDLKTALVPSQKRKEMALFFDTLAINSGWYALPVFQRILPLFSFDSNNSVLVGDYTDSGAGQKRMIEAMRKSVTPTRELEITHASQYFIVYINNLTDEMMRKFHEGLLNWDGYVGYADTTYTSTLKTLLSTTLVNSFIKHRRKIIQEYEDELSYSEDVNVVGYPFEDYGYICRSAPSLLMGTLLSYKIERPVFPGFTADTEFSLNAISPDPQPLQDFVVEVEKGKFDYIKSKKSGLISKTGLENITASQLAEHISAKISSNYIFNMSFVERYGVAKFNVIIEFPRSDNESYLRLLAAMEYKPQNGVLRLITLS